MVYQEGWEGSGHDPLEESPIIMLNELASTDEGETQGQPVSTGI
jgi:hypothetical protein